MLLVLFSVVFFSMCKSFLLNSTNFSSGGGGTALTDKHYITVVDMITEEKQARHQLEQYVIQLSKEIATHVKENSHSKNDSDQINNVLKLKNETYDLKQSLALLEGRYNQLLTANDKIVLENAQLQISYKHLQSQYNTCSNNTNELKDRLDKWDKSATALKINYVTEIQTKFKVAESNINSLISNGNARSQDFVAILNEVKQINTRNNHTDSQISMLKLTTDNKLSDLGKLQMDLNQSTTNEIGDLKLHMNQTGKQI